MLESTDFTELGWEFGLGLVRGSYGAEWRRGWDLCVVLHAFYPDGSLLKRLCEARLLSELLVRAPPPPRAEWLCPGSPASRPRVRRPRSVRPGGGIVPPAGFLACGLELSAWSGVGRTPIAAQVSSAPGAMASRGRKRKAEAAGVAAAEKREKPASGRKAVEEATVVIEHW